ncbi:MAG: chemotaxis protein, partial [Roseibium sp.]|nr:chemotaxis protein [Roseibium sp.]
YGESGKIIGYHSNRRVPNRRIVDDIITPLYAQLRQTEQQADNRKTGMQAGHDQLVSILQSKGVSYDELIHTL